MKIIIHDEKDQRTISIPNWLLVSNFNAFVMVHTVGKKSGATYKQLKALLAVLKEYRKEHPEWVLVDVDAGDGTYVRVSI